jgi:hypothetical protein
METEDSAFMETSTSMPIFKFIKSYVRVEQENRRFGKKEKIFMRKDLVKFMIPRGTNVKNLMKKMQQVQK